MSNDNKPISIQNSPLTREGYKIFGRSDRERKHNGHSGDIVRLKRATSAIIYGNDSTRKELSPSEQRQNGYCRHQIRFGRERYCNR